MKDKIYTQDLNPGNYKTILETYACTDCGLIPHYELSPPGIKGLNLYLSMKNWNSVNNQVKCPQCMRKIKIKNIIDGN